MIVVVALVVVVLIVVAMAEDEHSEQLLTKCLSVNNIYARCLNMYIQYVLTGAIYIQTSLACLLCFEPCERVKPSD